jgi:hypothetical protein
MAKINKAKNAPSLISAYLNKKSSKEDLKKDSYLNISFRHLDKEQGATLEDWAESGFLLSAVNVLRNICCATLKEQLGKAIDIYGSFPVAKSDYSHPKQVPEDAQWGRIHIDGVHILAGHFVENTFYVVFLDDNHSFYKVELKHT